METNRLESKAWFRFLKLIYLFAFVAVIIILIIVAYDTWPKSIVDNNNSVVICNSGQKFKIGYHTVDALESLAAKYGGVTTSRIETENQCITGIVVGEFGNQVKHAFSPSYDGLTDLETGKRTLAKYFKKDSLLNSILGARAAGASDSNIYSEILRQNSENVNYVTVLNLAIQSGANYTDVLEEIIRQSSQDNPTVQDSGYTVDIVEKTVPSWSSYLWKLILSIVIILIVFEIIRRSFFYIATGKKLW